MRCAANAAPLPDQSACGCDYGYTEAGGGACDDIDECAVNAGVCDTRQNVTSRCCNRFSSCANAPGGFNCAPCMPGFVGSAYGVDGCSLAAASGGSGSAAAVPPEVSFTLNVVAPPAVAEGGVLAALSGYPTEAVEASVVGVTVKMRSRALDGDE
eukprot:SAG11_NODE_9413_length_914_cov_1.431902_1_plen_154_part_01